MTKVIRAYEKEYRVLVIEFDNGDVMKLDCRGYNVNEPEPTEPVNNQTGSTST